jgi:hypothetical protein
MSFGYNCLAHCFYYLEYTASNEYQEYVWELVKWYRQQNKSYNLNQSFCFVLVDLEKLE